MTKRKIIKKMMSHKEDVRYIIENMGNAARINRERAASNFTNNSEMTHHLTLMAFDVYNKLHHKAAWVLEILLETDLQPILRHIDYFCNNLHQLKNDSAIRPISKICKWLAIAYVKKQDSSIIRTIQPKHIELIIETGFDWMIGNYKVATQAYTMDTLYYFGSLKLPETEWVHEELKNVVLQKINTSSVAYKAHARMILKQLEK